MGTKMTHTTCLVLQHALHRFKEKQEMHFVCLQCRQLIQDQLPERKGQLYSTYGPGGAIPLIPEAQSGSPPLSIQTLDTSDGSGQYIQIFNGNSVAVDVSGYKLQGSTSMTLQPGQYDTLYKCCSSVLKQAETFLLTMQDDCDQLAI